MHVAVTGATGFLGRYIVNHLLDEGHTCRCWYRPASDRGGFQGSREPIEWLRGDLGEAGAAGTLVNGVDAVVHAALDRPGAGFGGAEGDLLAFVQTNLIGSLRLMQAARQAGVSRFVFISTCAVHDVILDDRPLDETHPLWPASHYGAHKAAIEKFVHSFGLRDGYAICALRPTGIYGLARPVERSRWFELIQNVKAGKPIRSAAGGKEVHAADVARAVGVLLNAENVAGQAFNCCDGYVAEQEVAEIAKEMTGSSSEIAQLNRGPKHQIATDKLRTLGVSFGGRPLLVRTIQEMLEAVS